MTITDTTITSIHGWTVQLYTIMSDDISKAAAALGRKGGAARSDAKTAAVRANGAKGGRPSLDRDSLIVAIIQAKPHLARIGNLAMGGSKGAINQLAEQACGMGGGYLTPSQWLEVSKWGIND